MLIRNTGWSGPGFSGQASRVRFVGPHNMVVDVRAAGERRMVGPSADNGLELGLTPEEAEHLESALREARLRGVGAEVRVVQTVRPSE